MMVIVKEVLRDDVAVDVCVCVVCIKLKNELFPLFFFWGSLGTSDELLDSGWCVDRPTLCPSPVHPTLTAAAVIVVVWVVVFALHRRSLCHKHGSQRPFFP